MRFGEWLGKENGKTMLAEVFKDGTVNQAKAAITTYCCIFDIEVDTREWDELIRWTYDYYNSWFDTYDEFDAYMCADLV